MPQIRARHIKRTDDGDHYCLRVPRGKDTANGDGKQHDAYLPPDVESDIHRYVNAVNLEQHTPLVDLTERGVREVVKRTAGRAAETTATREGGDADVNPETTESRETPPVFENRRQTVTPPERSRRLARTPERYGDVLRFGPPSCQVSDGSNCKGVDSRGFIGAPGADGAGPDSGQMNG